jgi:hypothetical protein
MKMVNTTGTRTALLTMLLIGMLLLAGCGKSSTKASPTATVAPTATPVPPTATPEPTATPVPERDTQSTVTTSDAPPPEVTIPQDFDPVSDEARGYSLALPGGWSTIDLRGDNVQRMAGTFGLADQLVPLNEFLDSPEGDAVGVVAATDLAAVLFGGMPTILNVFVVDAPGATPDTVMAVLEETIRSNSAALGDVSIGTMEATTVNNLPAVTADGTVDLSAVGMDAELYAKVTGLIANDKVYVLTLATEAGNRSKKEATFDDIIGTFRPE